MNTLFNCIHAKKLWRKLCLLDIIEKALLVDRSGSVALEEVLHAHEITPTHIDT